VSDVRVRGYVQRGEIEGRIIAGRWRFRRTPTERLEWLQRETHLGRIEDLIKCYEAFLEETPAARPVNPLRPSPVLAPVLA
jgi:hypothetical protein